MKQLQRPNILLIYTDQQRWDSLQCYGNELAITPNLDALAKDGVLFHNNFIQNPVCTPSRISMLTGRYCNSTGVGSNGYSFPGNLTPVNQLLKPYGYHTAQIGKLHFDPHAKRDHKNPTDTFGFDTFILSDEPGCYDDAYTKWVENINQDMLDGVRISLAPASVFYNQPSYSDVPRNTHEPYIFEAPEEYTHSSFVTSESCRFIEEHKNQKFFLISGFYAPHTPVNPPKRFLDLYDVDKMPLPKVGDNETTEDYLQGKTPKEWQEIYQYYMALVSHVDDCVGKIIKSLKDNNIYDKTMIIFTSDHGEYLGDHGRIQKGMPGHDCITRVPLIISSPQQFSPALREQLTESVDIVPTILDYCGIQTPNYIQGTSLKKVIENNDSHKSEVITEYFDNTGYRESTIRTEEFKYTCSSSGNEYLYDLKNDPHELNNEINNNVFTESLSNLRKLLIMKLQQTPYNGGEIDAPY